MNPESRLSKLLNDTKFREQMLSLWEDEDFKALAASVIVGAINKYEPVWHEPTELLTTGHKHRSGPELDYCRNLQPKYQKNYIHPNLCYKGIEIDFVISDPTIFKEDDPSTWLEVHEYHQVQFWKGEIKEEYVKKRTRELSRRGSRVPTTIVCRDKYGLHKTWLPTLKEVPIEERVYTGTGRGRPKNLVLRKRIKDMLLTGSTYTQIKTQLTCSNDTITKMKSELRKEGFVTKPPKEPSGVAQQ